MAKTYSVAEATKIIQEGTDLNAINDIGRRYPVLLQKLATVAARAGESFTDLMQYMPAYVSANKVNMAIKKNLTGETSGDEDEDDEETVDDAPVKATAAPAKTGGKAKKEKEEEQEEDKYEGKGPADLFKLCKQRGIKAEMKKPAKYYTDLLVKADAAEATAADDEGWEDEVEEKPATKPANKSAGKPTKPAAKSKKDEDEEWEI